MIEENRLKKIASVNVPRDALLSKDGGGDESEGPAGEEGTEEVKEDAEEEAENEAEDQSEAETEDENHDHHQDGNAVRVSGFDDFAKTGCAVIMRIGGTTGCQGWGEVIRGSEYEEIGARSERSIHQKGFPLAVTAKTIPCPRMSFLFGLFNPYRPSRPRRVESWGVNLVSSAMHNALQTELDALGEKRKDSPAPKYHNNIDPNVGTVNDSWVPTEFDVSESPIVETIAMIERACQNATGGSNLPQEVLEKAAKLHRPALARAEMRSPILDLDPHENSKLYIAVQDVMEVALALLVRMRNPALLLPGPLQAVFKAQRIVLKQCETYQGVWREDGVRENAVAVVLYYYRVSPTLTGGDIEIASKVGSALGSMGAGQFTEDEARKNIDAIPRIKVPVKQGTLLVFSNYAASHRVLPMEATGGPGSRDFLAFCVIDQRDPLPMFRELGPLAARKQRRKKLLQEQLQPKGRSDWTVPRCTPQGMETS